MIDLTHLTRDGVLAELKAIATDPEFTNKRNPQSHVVRHGSIGGECLYVEVVPETWANPRCIAGQWLHTHGVSDETLAFYPSSPIADLLDCEGIAVRPTVGTLLSDVQVAADGDNVTNGLVRHDHPEAVGMRLARRWSELDLT